MTQPRKKKPAPKINLKAYDRNPNSMAEEDKAMLAKSLAEHGDLSGIVWNRKNGKLVGGHQRIDVLRRLGDGACPVEIERELEKPTKQGTVGWGSVTFGGESFPVRVVEWSETQHQQAMIAANRFGRIGVDDQAVIKDLLEELDDGSRDMDLTGYDEKARELLATCDTPIKPVAIQEPPRMAWVLVGVPIGEWGKVSGLAEAAALIDGSIVETTANDGIKEN